MVQVSYNVDVEDGRKLAAWEASLPRPALFLALPPLKNIGEDELIYELATKSYRCNGFSDSFERHFMQRNFPYGGSPGDYEAFLDDARNIAEITDEFFGVDSIDLTDWASKPLGGAMWRRLIHYVRTHGETDFVFTARVDDPEKAEDLVRSIRSECGLAIEIITLHLPLPNALAEAFIECSGGRFAERQDILTEWFGALQKDGRSMNFTFAQTCAFAASYECARTGDERKAFKVLFDRYSSLTPQMEKSVNLGF